MAAGLGFKTFVVGDVLTATDTNGYLMQGVLVFASAAARDSAITSPQEGQFAYLKDTNVTTYYTGSAWANLDTTGMTNPMTTTGDTIYSSSGSTPARLGIGSTGQVLTVAAGLPSWATPSSSSTAKGCYLRGSGNQSISSATTTTITWTAENFDTNAFHDNSTNPERITIPAGCAGKYQIDVAVFYAGNGSGARELYIYLNNTTYYNYQVQGGNASANCINTSFILDLAVGDYLAIKTYQDSGCAINVLRNESGFAVGYLGA
jgi:hypothetical protein